MSSNALRLLILSVQLYLSFQLEDPVIQLPNGSIRGRLATTLNNVTFLAFHGIPYAAPPLGDLRFKPPQPVVNWTGIRDASHMETTCIKRGRLNETGAEDCLFLNVFTPRIPDDGPEDPLPVMVYIHGGGFYEGDGVSMGPDLFIEEDVIFVAMNYRLGIFGFISTQDEVIPGNNGLKDQQQSLRWVHDNIHLFGGDPERVTLFGESAGGASVAYQLLNQDNTGLIQAAILQSGTILSPWAFQRRPREIAFATAAFLNSTFENSNDSQALLDYLRTVDPEDLDAAQVKYLNSENTPEDMEIYQGLYFAPVIEPKNPDAFLTRKMYGLLKAGSVIQVPIIAGITSEEGLTFNQDPDTLLKILTEFDNHPDWLVLHDMEITNSTFRTQMGTSIRDLYTGGSPLVDNLGDGVRYCSDTFSRPVIKYAELFSQFAKTYFYVFSYDGDLGTINNNGPVYDGTEKVGHAEDIYYLFCAGTGCDDSGYAEGDRVARRRLVRLWANFAKTYNPTPNPEDDLQNVTWPILETDGGDFAYLDIGEDLTIKNHPREATYGGWVELYDSLGYDDFDTY